MNQAWTIQRYFKAISFFFQRLYIFKFFKSGVVTLSEENQQLLRRNGFLTNSNDVKKASKSLEQLMLVLEMDDYEPKL